MDKKALISDDGKYRHWLSRTWDETRSPIAFIMLNPSTADDKQDDPTIRRCVGFAKLWVHGSIVVVNLFDFRSHSPVALKQAFNPCSKNNNAHILERCRFVADNKGKVVAAWGLHGSYKNRDREVAEMLARNHIPLWALQLIGSDRNTPGHPLFIPYEQHLKRWYCNKI